MSSSDIAKKPPMEAAAWCFTDYSCVNFSYAWSIGDFELVEMKISEEGRMGELKSSVFKVNVEGEETMWSLSCLPYCAGRGESGHVPITISLNALNKAADNKIVTFFLSLVNGDGVRVNKEEGYKGLGCQRATVANFISLAALRSDSKLLPGNSLHFYCEMKIVGVRVVTSGSETSGPTWDLGEGSCPRMDMMGLLTSGDNADVALVCEGKYFPCHKMLLSNASPVFEAAFRHDTEERDTGEMVIDDMEKDTVYDLLTFIYGGKIAGMKDKVEKLLVAAENYDLKLLKDYCEKLMTNGLTIENCLDYLLMADLHSAMLLKSAVIKFIVNNGKELARKGTWMETLVGPLSLLAEITQEMFLTF